MESSKTIKVLAIHPPRYDCPLEDNSLLFFWKEKDYLQILGLMMVSATEIMLEMAGKKRCNYGCGARYKASRDTHTLILKHEPTLYNFDTYYRKAKSL